MSIGFRQLRITLPPEQTPCRFFVKGHCSRGEACFYKHDPQDVRPKPPCTFFQRGHCRYGENCRFRHIQVNEADDGDKAAGNPLDQPAAGAPPIPNHAVGTVSRIMSGATVTFGPGAEIESVTLPESKEVINSLSGNTVVCVWRRPGPSAEIILQSKSDARRLREIIRDEERYHRVHTDITYPSARPSRQEEHVTLRVDNLPVGETEQDLRRCLKNGPKMVYIGPTDITMSPERTEATTQAETIKMLFRKYYNAANTFSDNLPLEAPSTRLKVHFTDPGDMEKVIKKFHQKFLPGLHSRLYVHRVITVSHPVRLSVYRVLSSDYEDLRGRLRTEYNVVARESPPDDVRGLMLITLTGYNKQALAKAKSAINIFFAGVVARDEEKALWHPYFARPEGLTYLKMVMASSEAFIYRDNINNCLRLFGSPSAQSEALGLLLAKIEELHDHRTTLVIRSTDYEREAFNEIYRHLLDTLGPAEKLELVVGSGRQRLKVKAMPDVMQSIHSYRSTFAMKPNAADDITRTCSICWTEPDDPITLPCDHIYCSGCFTSQCEADSNSHFPVRCLSRQKSASSSEDSTMCNVAVPLPFLRSILAMDSYDALLDRALAHYVKTNPTRLRHCPTPDCHHLYMPLAAELSAATSATETSNGACAATVFACPGCLQTTCRKCHTASHPELSCAESLDLASGGELAFRRWKAANAASVKDCPKCAATIQKVDGCNHVHCTQCLAHICWFCREWFEDTDACYTHMEEKHEDGEDTEDDEHSEREGDGEDEDEGEDGDAEDESDEEDSDEDAVAPPGWAWRRFFRA